MDVVIRKRLDGREPMIEFLVCGMVLCLALRTAFSEGSWGGLTSVAMGVDLLPQNEEVA